MNTIDALRLHRVHVRRTPGIDAPYTLDALCAGLNLVYGPNASGKSSTVRAIEAVLWPAGDAPRALGVSARYSLGGAEYVVELDAGHRGVQRDGAEARAPELPAPELRQRYHLSLHDLLLATNRTDDFAAEIARQSNGGYDFERAAKALRLRDRPSTAAPQAAALSDARQKLKAAQDAQARLHEEARQLGELEARRVEAGRARTEEQRLARAIAHATSSATLARARARLDAFPAVLARVQGNELQRLEKLAGEARAAAEEESAQSRRADAEDARAGAVLPGGAVAREVLPRLREVVVALEASERTVREEARRAHDAAAQVSTARQAIGGALTDAQLEAIDGVTFGDLADFAREADRLHAERTAVEAELRLASEGGAQATAPALDEVRAGVRLLAQWLREPDAAAAPDRARARRGLVWALAGVAVVASLGLAAVWNPLAIVGVGAAIVLAVLALRDPVGPTSTRATRERDYAALGLATPAAWTVDQVLELFDQLQRTLADGRVAERRAQWADDARGRRDALEPRHRALEARRAELVAQLGVAPEADARHLAWLGEQIGRWRDALRTARGAEAALATSHAQRATALADVARLAVSSGSEPPADAATARALVTTLTERLTMHESAVERAAAARELAGKARADRLRAEAELAAIFDACECAPGDVDALRARCAQRAPYVEAAEAARVAERVHADARAAVDADALHDPSLLHASAEELEARRAAAEGLAADFEGLVKACSALETRIEDAKRKDDVERALAEVAVAEAALRAMRANDLQAMIGDTLLREVQRRALDEQRPDVFRRAREIFANITRGRYHLEFVDGEVGKPPAFRAIDTPTARGHALDELSSATRVQLLLAVRVAFVESQERGTKLPLFLDETLGTSDDHRAAAIIDAVIALAESGRQVFYFTAQRDEVMKWSAALASRTVAHRVLDLAALRNLEPEPVVALPTTSVVDELLPPLPSLDGHTHESYGVALGVPALRAGHDAPTATHLWYVIEDLDALHHLLRDGVSRWGELENLVTNGDASVLSEWRHLHVRARALMRAVAVMHEQAAIGRGGVVDRRILIDSGAVSDRMLPAVTELMRVQNGDAKALVDALERKTVPGFQARQLEKLRAYLESKDLLDDRPRRTSAEIRAAMLDAVEGDIALGTLAADDIDRLRERIERHATAMRGVAAGAAASLSVSAAVRRETRELPA